MQTEFQTILDRDRLILVELRASLDDHLDGLEATWALARDDTFAVEHAGR
jgi:hypothetical protein